MEDDKKSSDTLVQRMAQRVDTDKYKKLREGSATFSDKSSVSLWDALKARARKLVE